MASGNNDGPFVVQPKPEEQSAKNDTDNGMNRKEDSPISVDDPQCIRHQEQEQKSQKNSWKTWFLSHCWRPFKERPRWVWWAVIITFSVVVIGVIVAGIIFAIYYGTIYYRIAGFLLREGLGGHDKASLSQGTPVSVSSATRSVEGQQPYIVERDADCGIAGIRDIEKTSTRSRKAKKRVAQQHIWGNQDSYQAYREVNIYCPTGMTFDSRADSPSDIYCCRDALNYPDTKDTLSRDAENTFQYDRFLGGGWCQIGSACSPDGCLITVFALSKDHYIPPSAYTVTATSSTKAFEATKIGETARSDGPMGIRPGFGFSSIPILEEITLGAALAAAWIATWRYL
ncbi:hypothetical protein F4823DRAFT_558896 [Ustulina deusta]|nr:hypothetical protein F4823DRAFT_558896 [Ustulina deusta]